MAMWTDNGKFQYDCERLLERVRKDLETRDEEIMVTAICKYFKENRLLVPLDYALHVDEPEQNAKFEALQLEYDYGKSHKLLMKITLKDLNTYLTELNADD